jgi:ribonucleoside-diphosphate reductase alpha subunit
MSDSSTPVSAPSTAPPAPPAPATNTVMDLDDDMRVKKRDGTLAVMSFDKILRRIRTLRNIPGIDKAPLHVDSTTVTRKVIEQLHDKMETTRIDELTSEICASMATKHIDYATMASRVLVSNHHKETPQTFAEVMHDLYHFKDAHGEHSPLLAKFAYEVSQQFHHVLEEAIDYSRDYLFDFFGFRTLERAYLMRIHGRIVERPQHMWMRVSIGIHGDDIPRVIETYNAMSQLFFTHATPTLFNSATPRSQMSSCYLLAMEEDSIAGMYKTLGDCAAISKWAGGIGLHIHNIRATGSHIRGTNGKSSGLVPMLRVYNSTARHVNQGGRRNGSFAMYLEPWHGDIEMFLQMRKNHGDEEMKARDLFYALWVPNLFMRRVEEGGDWTLMCPDRCPGLSDAYGEAFDALYQRYEAEGRGIKTIPARKLWFDILDAQIETGTPYILFKDQANRFSNQKNLGTIKSSNLCTEIIEYSNDKETAVCNLASIGLSKYVTPPNADRITASGPVVVYSKAGCVFCKLAKFELEKHNIPYGEVVLDHDETRLAKYAEWSEKTGRTINSVPQIWFGEEHVGGYTELTNRIRPTFDFAMLERMTRVITRNLNNIIDRNFYPTDKTFRSNMMHRPIGIGIQGLADVFVMMGLPFDSPEAQQLNKDIFKTIYYAALRESNLISRERSDAVKEFLDTKCPGRTLGMAYNMEAHDSGSGDHDLPDVQYIDAGARLHTAEVFGYGVKATRTSTPPSRPLDLVGSYSSFIGSPASEGVLQFDMWGDAPDAEGDAVTYDWDALKADIRKYGLRNSLLVAPMPTASTSQILGNNECFEPFTSNIYMRRTLAGNFMVVNKYLIRELSAIGEWSDEVKNSIIFHKGSIQHLEGIPACVKEKYRIVWELPMRSLIDMAAARGRYICQSQSMNLWMEEPTYQKLTAMHMHSWKSNLKTGIYYLRTKAKAAAQQFTIDPTLKAKAAATAAAGESTAAQSGSEEEEGCLMCSG